MTQYDTLHKLLLTNTQVLKIHEAISNSSTANIKFSKTDLSKVIQSGGYLPVFTRYQYLDSCYHQRNQQQN